MAGGSDLNVPLGWFLTSFLFFTFLWLAALVPFTLALVHPGRPAARRPKPLAEAERSILALNEPSNPFRIVPVGPREFRLEWDVVDASWAERYARVKLNVVYRARLLVYEPEHEVRYHESIRSSSFFVGLDGWRPRLNFGFFYQSGVIDVIWSGLAYGIEPGFPPRIGEVYRFSLDTIQVKRRVDGAARRVGWGFRPVIWGFETTTSGAAWAARITPRFMRRWPRRRTWGTLYALSYVGLIGTAVVALPPTPHNLLVGVLVFGGIAAIHAVILGAFTFLNRTDRRR
jgi:hypothetical protein